MKNEPNWLRQLKQLLSLSGPLLDALYKAATLYNVLHQITH